MGGTFWRLGARLERQSAPEGFVTDRDSVHRGASDKPPLILEEVMHLTSLAFVRYIFFLRVSASISFVRSRALADNFQ